jgi:phosphate uptake regulator
MLRELLSIFRSGNPLKAMADNFAEMLNLAYGMTVRAGKMYFEKSLVPDERTWVRKQDVTINRLQRVIRKQVIAHLSIRGNSPSLPYCLALMSLVKDVERIGDYAKNLAEAPEFCPGPLAEDEHMAELREISKGVEAAFDATARVFQESDRERALELIYEGRDFAKRADALVASVARSSHNACEATTLVLGTRYYKRIGAHVLNVLSSVVMPLHKLDYFDEDEVESDWED